MFFSFSSKEFDYRTKKDDDRRMFPLFRVMVKYVILVTFHHMHNLEIADMTEDRVKFALALKNPSKTICSQNIITLLSDVT